MRSELVLMAQSAFELRGPWRLRQLFFSSNLESSLSQTGNYLKLYMGLYILNQGFPEDFPGHPNVSAIARVLDS